MIQEAFQYGLIVTAILLYVICRGKKGTAMFGRDRREPPLSPAQYLERLEHILKQTLEEQRRQATATAITLQSYGRALENVHNDLKRMERLIMTVHDDVGAKVDALDAKVDAAFAAMQATIDDLRAHTADPDKTFTAAEVTAMLDKVEARIPATAPATPVV